MTSFNIIRSQKGLIKAWTSGVPVEDAAVEQLGKLAAMPFIFKHVAVMPDVHLGRGATVGSVVPTVDAIIPAAVGVDIGCGMSAQRTSLTASDLPDNLFGIRSPIESAVPHGRVLTAGRRDKGSWGNPPHAVTEAWGGLSERFEELSTGLPRIRDANALSHLGTLGTGNHFIEVCLDEADRVWVMLHSGSRGVGNQIGQHYIEMAKREMERWFIQLPDTDLSYLPEGSEHFTAYTKAVSWAQDYALVNRELMMKAALRALREGGLPAFTTDETAVNCHHNYVSRENHFGRNIWVTRKGAVRARRGDLGIIPGSMGAKSFIVRGKGNLESFHSCSHGAGRRMSRTAAAAKYTVEDHIEATKGIECRKDADVIDETPMAYKDIDAVMAAQTDLVSIEHTLRQVVCVKG